MGPSNASTDLKRATDRHERLIVLASPENAPLIGVRR
jgi:hypothetical protein